MCASLCSEPRGVCAGDPYSADAACAGGGGLLGVATSPLSCAVPTWLVALSAGLPDSAWELCWALRGTLRADT